MTPSWSPGRRQSILSSKPTPGLGITEERPVIKGVSDEIMDKLRFARFQELWRHFLERPYLPPATKRENYFSRKTRKAMRLEHIRRKGLTHPVGVLAVGFAEAIVQSARARVRDKEAVMRFLDIRDRRKLA